MAHPFLSDDWIDEARAIRAEYQDRTPSVPHEVRMNLVVTELPFADGQLDAHLETGTGQIELDKGHLESPDLTVTVDYDTARAILVEGNPQAGLQAFMAGKVKVDGDMTKLMVLQSLSPDPSEQSATRELAERLREITR
ncbi:MAG TPA: SCP2 sterol-binding domain-containing protein [Acidimicrobiales bacterium]|nr:SCP2 sterol-binding domain-containing protein [Acidimicrobiales bacterium]